MSKTYDTRLATRITSSVDSRLRQLALLDRRRISHLLDDVLDQALPSAEELAGRFAHPACTAPGLPPPPPACAPQPSGTGRHRTRSRAIPRPRARRDARP